MTQNSTPYVLSIVIPTWCNYQQLHALLDNLYKDLLGSGISFEVIVVDDTPPMQRIAIAERPNLKVYLTTGNTRFALATNMGLTQVQGQHILLLNDDIFGIHEATPRLLHYALDSQEAIIAPQLLAPDGSIQPSIRRLPTFLSVLASMLPFPIAGIDWKLRDFNYSCEDYIEQPYFSAILISKSALDHVGLIDPRFPMYFTDVDWAQRAHDLGYRIKYWPQAQYVHYHGVSGSKLGFKREWLWLSSFFAFFAKKYRQKPLMLLVNVLVFPFFAFAKFAQALLKQQSN